MTGKQTGACDLKLLLRERKVCLTVLAWMCKAIFSQFAPALCKEGLGR